MTMAYSFVLCGPLPSHSHFQFPSFPPTKTPLSIPPSNLTPPQIIKMEFRPKNGFNLEEDDPAGEFSDDRKRRPVAGGSGPKRPGGAAPPSCQADSCPAVLTDAKRYHRRHKVCEFHAKSAVVVVAGLRQRFCQQCSRFHELSEFDEAKRSCRRRLAGHNERRRKCSPSDPSGDGPTVKLESLASRGSIQCKASSSDEKSRAGISSSAGNSAPSSASAYNHFRIG